MSELKPMTVKQLVLRITDLIKRGKIIHKETLLIILASNRIISGIKSKKYLQCCKKQDGNKISNESRQ